jgi:GDP-L-fucose synthase
MDKMNILITGGNGYIAKSIYSYLKNKHDITSITRADFDLTDCSATTNWFLNKRYDIVIHTAIVGGSRLKVDSDATVQQNLKMIFNLHENKHTFNKLITFGSGAEIFQPNTSYGISKKAIAEIVNATENWYNLRIFGVFDQNELSTRFIKGNILRYLRKKPMMLHGDKIMDFYYMNDLMTLLDHYIQTTTLDKTVNCSYNEKYTLTYLANFINNLDNHKVPVIIESTGDLQFYCGNAHNVSITEVGVKQGIINTFNYLKDLNNDSGNCE